MTQQLQNELSSPAKRPAPAKRKTTMKPTPTERTKRLSRAREELDVALHAAVGGESEQGYEQDEEAESMYSEAAGDMTVANEDFTMVSVETLQSMKQYTSQLLDDSGIEKSVASVSWMPSSPPRRVQAHSASTQIPQYPEISMQAEQAKARPTPESIAGYDAMSWKLTGPSNTTTLQKSKMTSSSPNGDPKAWQLEREAVSQKIEAVSRDEVIYMDDDSEEQATTGAVEDQGEDDIWTEEASRSMEEEYEQQQVPSLPQHSTTAAINDLFSDQQVKPPRGKIPRTWRRTSGVNFSYVDSPEYGALKSTRKVSGTDTDGEGGASRSSGGVLTPPESSDGEQDAAKPSPKGEDEDDTSLTYPDAEATQLQTHHQKRSYRSPQTQPARILSRARHESCSLSSDSDSSGTSPDSDGNDTGMFWQTNLPSLYPRRERLRYPQSQREKAKDLSELLREHNRSNDTSATEAIIGFVKNRRHASTDAKPSRVNRPVRRNALNPKIDSRLQTRAAVDEKVISSPLRKSLLKGSKIGGSPLPDMSKRGKEVHQRSPSPVQIERESSVVVADQTDIWMADGSAMESFESKASDQRQLIAEMKSATTTKERSDQLEDPNKSHDISEGSIDQVDEQSQYLGSEADCEVYEEGSESEETEKTKYNHEDYDKNEREHQASRSYEEHLNLESPQKIRVKFNDSEGNSSMLVPKKEYPPLFGSQSESPNHDQPKSPPSVTLVPKKTSTLLAEIQPGFFSRLSNTFWSAVVRPSGPLFMSPTPEPEYLPSLRAQIRNRYGVLSDQHPWTMAHMRVLHRLLNSCTSGMSDSIVPKTGALPYDLQRLIGKNLQSVTDFRWKFTEQHAHVVDAFMQVLVSAHYIEAIRQGEVEFIGDDSAKLHHGWFGGRHGDDLVFEGIPFLKLPKGAIQRDFVVKALGNAVSANIETARKEAVFTEEKRRTDSQRSRIEADRREWERKIGVVHDEDEESSTQDEDEGQDEDEKSAPRMKA